MEKSSKMFFLVIVFQLYTVCYSQVDQIHFGSVNTPLNGLTITWRSIGNTDSLKWGYSNSYLMG